MPTNTDHQGAIAARLTAVMADLSGYAENELTHGGTFLELGFDSLFLTQLATAFQKEFGVAITFRQLITDHPTPDALAAWIGAQIPAPENTPKAEAKSEASAPAKPQVRQPGAQAGQQAGTGRARNELSDVFARQLELMRAQLALFNGEGAVENAPVVAEAPAETETPVKTETPPAPIFGTGPQIPQPNDTQKRSPDMTPAQRTHIETLTARYTAKTARSKQHAASDRAYHADPRSAAGFNPHWKELVYPLVVNKSDGAYLWDLDDNRYIDLLNGFGPNFFGHRAPFITDALKAQLDDGFEIGPQTPHAGEAAKLLCELTGMDRASWVNTGSEAVQAAIRIARTVTGRDKIVVFKGSYHGNFDEVLVRGVERPDGAGRTLPLAPGIPFGSVENVIVLDYGADAALEAIAKNAGDIAAILVEPVQSRRPDFQPRAFLQTLRTLTAKRDIALIFDEVITGFRTSPGGAQDYFGVKADLATYGKILGGGMPIGAVAGAARYMDTFDGGSWRYGDASKPEAGVTFFAGTFVRHPLAIAAAYASLKHLQDAGAQLQERVSAHAARFADELNAFFQDRGVGFRVLQFASQMFIRVEEQTPLATLFFYHMRDRGVHLLENFPCYMTAAHTDADVTAAIEAAKESIWEMQAGGILADHNKDARDSQSDAQNMALTHGQRLIWSTSQMGEGASCAFNESDSFYLDGALDRARFVDAVNSALGAHEAFRLRFESAGAHQFIADAPGFSLQFQDVADLSAQERQAHIQNWLKAAATTAFDLEGGPLGRSMLFKLGAEEHLFVIYAHHLIFDGYSSDLLIRDIVRRYSAAVAGERAASSDIAPFSAYRSKAQNAPAVPAFWKDCFAEGAPPLLDLPTDGPRASVFSYRGATARRTLFADLCADVRARARSLGLTMSAMTMSAFAALLAGASERRKFVMGLPAAGQARHGVEAIGYCVNILPIPVNAANDPAFEAFARALQEVTLDAFENQDLSLSALMAHISDAPGPRNRPLIEAMFNYGGYFQGLEAAGVKIRAAENERHAVCNELFLNIADDGDVLHLDLEYAADLFDATTVDAWLDEFAAILRKIADDPSTALSALARGNDDEQASDDQPRDDQENIVNLESRRIHCGTERIETTAPATLNDTESEIIAAVGATLAQRDISLDDNFFELGGHSIHASRLLTRLRKTVAPTLSIRAIFEADSLRALAVQIDAAAAPQNNDREEFVF